RLPPCALSPTTPESPVVYCSRYFTVTGHDIRRRHSQIRVVVHSRSFPLLRNSFAERFDSGAYAGWIFFNWHEFVAALLGLPSEFRLESLFTLGISFCPNRGIVFDLFLN